jgi:hypothetical protein
MTPSQTNQQRTTIGRLEMVKIPSGRFVIAKIDTGAYSSSIHCDHVEERQEGDKTTLYYSLSHGKGEWLKADSFAKMRVRSSNGQTSERYAITMELRIGASHWYTALVTLGPRYDMKCEMLLGCRFLQENKLLVDVTQNYILSRTPVVR